MKLKEKKSKFILSCKTCKLFDLSTSKWTGFYYCLLIEELNKYHHCTNIYWVHTIY